MQRLEVSGAVRLIYRLLGVKGLKVAKFFHMIAVRLPDWLLELEKESITILYICIYKNVLVFFSTSAATFKKIN